MKLTIFIVFSVIVVMAREIYLIISDEARSTRIKRDFSETKDGLKKLFKMGKRKKKSDTGDPVAENKTDGSSES